MKRDPARYLRSLAVLAALSCVAAGLGWNTPADAQDDTSWSLLAYRTPVRTGQVVMHVDPDEGAVSAVRFQAQGRRIVVDRVRIEFHGDQERVDLRPRQPLRAGEDGAPLELPEPGAIRRVRVDCRVSGSRGTATLNLLAQRQPSAPELPRPPG